MIDIYKSAADYRGRYGLVFERDDDTSYLYLLDLTRPEHNQIVEAFDVHTVNLMSADAVVLLEWTSSSDAGGLFIDGHLTALFNLASEAPYGRWSTPNDAGRFAIY